VTEQELSDTFPLDRKRTVPFATLLEQVALGSTDEDVLSAIAGRLARMDRAISEPERALIKDASGGLGLRDLTDALVDALDPDRHVERARQEHALPRNVEPTDAQLADAAKAMVAEAVKPLASNPQLRQRLVDLKKSLEQVIDDTTKDVLLEAGYSAEATERARHLVESWERFIAEHKDQITAFQILYSQPHGRVQFQDIRALADLIKAPPRSWTPELLWTAYEKLQRDRVRGAGGNRLLTDIVSLVRFALRQADLLVPYHEQVEQRFAQWLAQQQTAGVVFTPEQLQWLELIRDHVAASMGIDIDDFDLVPFAQKGGAGKASQVFGERLRPLLNELNEVLAA
jgi:type I restriction enzyme R subunit